MNWQTNTSYVSQVKGGLAITGVSVPAKIYAITRGDDIIIEAKVCSPHRSGSKTINVGGPV